MHTDLEIRAFGGIELRQTGTGRPRLVGYAAVFDSRSLDLGGFVEIIRQGAFTRTLKAGTDVLAFVEHNAEHIVGRRSAKNLDLSEDRQGLRVEITPPDTSAGRDVIENVRAGNLDAMSFSFRIPNREEGQRWHFESEPILRELLDVDLREVSVVALPAYPDTAVALRSLSAARSGQVYSPSLELLGQKLRQAR